MIEKTVHFTSLGCSKNLVDSQVMLGRLYDKGFRVEENPELAEAIIVNTCAFIESAKDESIQTIIKMAEIKSDETALVVSGCLAQRYPVELEKEFPEVDLFIGTGEYHKVYQLLEARKEGSLEKKSFVEIPKYIHTEFDSRVSTTPSYMAWLKVSEGCDRKCTFCIIPSLRGQLRSRSVESLIVETKRLIAQGVGEINLISQDLSSYGADLGEDQNLVSLIEAFESIENLKWVRLFYHYPDELSDEVIAALKASTKVVHYLDMPVQHINTQILKRMNRKITSEKMKERIAELKKSLPDIVLRSSVIVGFPGETPEQFLELCKFVKEVQFDHLGVFKYSDEEGTPAYRLPDKNSQDVIDERFDEIYKIQKQVVHQKNQSWVGKTVEVLVEGEHPETELLISGRHYGQAPDIDGQVMINDTHGHSLKSGDFIKVKITEAFEYDLVGEYLVPSL